MFNDVKVLNDYRGDSMSDVTRSITLPMRTFEETPLIRSFYETKTHKGIELGFETPRPLFWLGSSYGYHWGCTMRHHVIADNTHDALVKAELWAKQLIEMNYFQSTEVSGPVINT